MRCFRDCKHGTAAVEFSLIAPIFLLMFFGIVCFGGLFGIYHSVQELASSAARAAIAGMSDTERMSIVSQYINSNAPSYLVIDPSHLTFTVSTLDSTTRSFEVDLYYDASTSYVYAFSGLIPLPNPHLKLSATVQRGGY